MPDVTKDPVAIKLNKAVGQLHGIVSMYQEDRSCLEIVQQVAAVRSALSSVAKDILTGEAKKCARSRTPEDFDRVLKTLVEFS
ncbi:metal-sensitive transcriptional regulator [Candidatus Woesebacteria bacterium]|nr:metal-sensitive transcriptional regulator [Candidatus Woesebacteria bacterium]